MKPGDKITIAGLPGWPRVRLDVRFMEERA